MPRQRTDPGARRWLSTAAALFLLASAAGAAAAQEAASGAPAGPPYRVGGGITRPEAAGHRLAISRAYGRAGYGVQTVSYFEGHGTGTALGDATELEALSTARRDSRRKSAAEKRISVSLHQRITR